MPPSYYIVFNRKNHVLFSFLKLRVVVDSRHIYPLAGTEPVVIPVERQQPQVVVTDGFHFTRPLTLTFQQPSYFHFDVVCAIDDRQLLAGSLLLAIFYLLGFLTGIFILKLLSFVPIAWFLAYYYIRRRDFIRIVGARRS
ncbi:MAG: hypothetical protein ABW019_16165 [Chitinophagaceae bacterium]